MERHAIFVAFLSLLGLATLSPMGHTQPARPAAPGDAPFVPRGGGTQARYRSPRAPDDAPETAGAGASRVYCPVLAADVDLTPVLPPSIGWGFTTNSNPTAWVSLKYDGPVNALPEAELSLVDRMTGDLIGDVETITLPDESGIFALVLPTLPDSDHWYEWYLELDCSPADDPDNYTYLDISGFIYQDSESIAGFDPEGTPQQRLDHYQADGIWYDAFDQLAQEHCLAPANPETQARLSDLLTAGELGSLMEAEIHCPE